MFNEANTVENLIRDLLAGPTPSPLPIWEGEFEAFKSNGFANQRRLNQRTPLP
jgi:hypothetical protein